MEKIYTHHMMRCEDNHVHINLHNCRGLEENSILSLNDIDRSLSLSLSLFLTLTITVCVFVRVIPDDTATPLSYPTLQLSCLSSPTP